MIDFSFVVSRILPPLTVVALVGGLVYRMLHWYRASVGKITLFPSAAGPTALWTGVAKQVFLFKSLWEADRSLWTGAWVFHAALGLIFVGHVRVVTDFPRLWAAMGMGPTSVDAMSAGVGGAVGLVILAVGVYLLVRRFTIETARDASKMEDYVALALLLAAIISGDAMRFLTHFDLDETRAYFAALVTFQTAPIPQSSLFQLHFFLAQLLLIYLPVGKLLHVPGVFFAHPLLRQD
jgi:nitrate reductase gamma subunit